MLMYSFKFTKLSKYAPSSVSDPRDELSRFLMRVSEDLVEECRVGCFMIIWKFLARWCMLNKWNRVGYGEVIGTLRGKDPMKEHLKQVG